MPLSAGCFKEAVMSSFAFLKEQFGFDCTNADDLFVQYKSNSLAISIWYDSYSFEVDLIFSRPGINEYRLPELMSLYGVEFEWGGTYAQASTPEALCKVVNAIATTLRQYGAALLGNDLKIFEQLAEQRRQSAIRAELNENRKKADAAWREKDCAGSVRLLEPIKSQLSPHETKRLEYARKWSGRIRSEPQ